MRATVWTSKYEQPGVFNVAETDVVSTQRLDASNLSPRDPEEELDGERGRAFSSRGIRTFTVDQSLIEARSLDQQHQHHLGTC